MPGILNTAQNSGPIAYIVDDERTISNSLVLILNASDFHAVGFTDPVEALRSAEGIAPDLLITDVIMPSPTGIDLAVRTSAINPSCKVLLFSGQTETADLLEKAKQGGHDFVILAKPAHPEDLLA